MGEDLGAAVVEAHPVDDRPTSRQPEKPGLVIARLGLRGDCAELDKAEAQGGPGLEADSVLVHTAGQPDQAWKLDSGDGNRSAVPGAEGGQRAATWSASAEPADRRQRLVVNTLGIATVRAKQQWPQHAAVAEFRDHGFFRLQDCSERTPTLPAMIASMP
jgi:hypothetical protein